MNKKDRTSTSAASLSSTVTQRPHAMLWLKESIDMGKLIFPVTPSYKIPLKLFEK